MSESVPSSDGCPFMSGKVTAEGTPIPAAFKPLDVTYWDYIATDVLLNSQTPASGLHHHDEHLFILVHQVFELWFKQIIREIESVREFMIACASQKTPSISPSIALTRLNRAEKILRHSHSIFGVLETMHPAEFAEFRDFIGPASGFQSVQMRELEILLGIGEKDRIQKDGKSYTFAFGEKQRQTIASREAEPKMKDVLQDFLASFPVPARFEQEFLKAKDKHLRDQKMMWFNGDLPRVQEAVAMELKPTQDFLAMEGVSEDARKARIAALFIESYRDSGDATMFVFAQILDAVIAFEEAMILWRHYHARMVERIIGRRAGTGGSSGVDYLDKTSHYRIFVDLWRARAVQVRPSLLPPLTEIRAATEVDSAI
eukprot:ANDGO_07479.mRNA.1 Tryptophan 2